MNMSGGAVPREKISGAAVFESWLDKNSEIARAILSRVRRLDADGIVVIAVTERPEDKAPSATETQSE